MTTDALKDVNDNSKNVFEKSPLLTRFAEHKVGRALCVDELVDEVEDTVDDDKDELTTVDDEELGTLDVDDDSIDDEEVDDVDALLDEDSDE